jgi:hypothetical protein
MKSTGFYFVQPLKKNILGVQVKPGGGFVQNEDLRILEYCLGNAKPPESRRALVISSERSIFFGYPGGEYIHVPDKIIAEKI